MEGCWWIVRGEFLDRGEGVGGAVLAVMMMCIFGDGWGRLRVGAPFGSHLYKGFGSFCYVWIVVSDSPFAMVPGVAAAFFCRDLFVTGGVKRSMKVVFRGRDLLSHYRLSFVGILSSGESRDDLSGRKDDDMQQATEMPLFSDGLNTCDRTPDIIAELAEVSPDQFHSA